MTQLVGKQTDRRKLVDTLYELAGGHGKEMRDLSSAKVAVLMDGHDWQIKDRAMELEAAGIIGRRYEYGSPKNGMTPGRHYHWTLLLPKGEALKILDRLDVDEAERQHANRSKGNGNGKHPEVHLTVATDRPAITVRDSIPVEAIIGPEPMNPFEVLRPLRKDESYALTEAARQYRDRGSTMNASVDTLVNQAKALGIAIDIPTLRNAIDFGDEDPRLENVCEALPYIERLEGEVSRLTNLVEALREKSRRVDALDKENKALRAQVDRLVAEKTALRSA